MSTGFNNSNKTETPIKSPNAGNGFVTRLAGMLIVLLVLFCLILIILVGKTNAPLHIVSDVAETDTQKVDGWKNAYISYIRNSEIEEADYISNAYCLVCIDDDDVPELVIYTAENTIVYAYRKQTVEQIGAYSNMEAHWVDHYFYEKSGYHGCLYAGDADPVLGICPGCSSFTPVFDNDLDVYEAVEYDEKEGYYYKNGYRIPSNVYCAETLSITKYPRKGWVDAVGKDEMLEMLSK